MTGTTGSDYFDGAYPDRRARRAGLGAQGAHSLAALIQDEIIPRLVRAHGEEGAPPPDSPGPEDVESLARRALEEDTWTLLADLDRWLDAGVDVPTLLLDLLAPAARRLGVYWEEDVADFVDVTMGMWRLQELVHAISQRRPGAAPDPGAPRRALFAPVPGEQHGFGALVVEELFRRAGWDTAGARPDSPAALAASVAERPLDLVGLSVSCDRFVPGLSGLVGAVRRAARNPALIVMVGGPVFVAAPDLAGDIGADIAAVDGARAIGLCEARLAASRRATALVA
jgi:methanogenic corrinoid protein MtbC1